MKARTIASSLRSALVLSALLWLGGLPEAEAGVDVWTSLGPYGGYIEFLAIDPKTPTTLYAGNSRNVFKSTDGGGNWSAVNLGFTSSTYINAFAIDPQTPTTLYVGTAGGPGVAKSTDGGASWTAANVGLMCPTMCPRVYALAIDPRTPTTLYAGTEHSGAFKSTDGGSTWSAASYGLTYDQIEVLAIDPQTSDTLYAGTWAGVFKSTDGGGNWSGSGLPGRATAALVIDPQTPTTLYASSYASSGGVFKSTDGGSTWSAANIGRPYLVPRAFAIDPQTPTTLYAGADGSGVFKSTNGGSTWSTVNTGLTSRYVTSLAIDPETPSTLYAGTAPDSTVAGGHHGVFKSPNGGDDWSPANTGLTGLGVGGLLVDAQTPTTLYAVAAGLRKSLDSGNTWSEVLRGPRLIAQTPDALYASDGYGMAKSTDGGVSWTRRSAPWGTRALAIDPPTTLYASTYNHGVWKSTDDGVSWTAINTGLGSPPADVASLAIDPQTPTTLYAGGGASGVYKSTNGGETWTPVGPGRVAVALAIDPQTPTTLYAGTYYYAGSGGVFKSTDGGENWVNVGLTDLGVSALAIDPQTPSTLYAGTGGGVFKSTDRGDNWSALNTGLTDLSVWVLAIDPQTPTTLYAGTGMGVFALQQTTVGVATTVNFDSPTPPGGPGPLGGVFGGIDFGTGQWVWEGPYDVDSTNNIYFADSTGTSRTFVFSPAPRVLNRMSVFSPEPGTVTLSDDTGQTLSQHVATGAMRLVTTGWTRPSTTVTVSFTAGWALGVDDITYTTAP